MKTEEGRSLFIAESLAPAKCLEYNGLGVKFCVMNKRTSTRLTKTAEVTESKGEKKFLIYNR